jgi:aspartyl-tRNA(Asn)/glutamyl-tRNA(Gln) amidotransferase subunit B
MEEGSFRCDANISIRPVGQKEFGIRTELKNLNSFKHVEKAILYEIQRQTYVIEEGNAIIQETRLWDPSKNKTISMRGKEDAHDYRYFPDPDLVPLIVDDAWIQSIKATLPELPEARQARFIKDYNLSATDAATLTSSIELADFFEQTASPLADKKQAANWVMTTFLGMLNAQGITIDQSPIGASAFSRLLKLLEDNTINANAAKIVFDEMLSSAKDPETIVKEKQLEQVSDTSELEEMVKETIKENPQEAQAYKDGKTKLFSFFMGQIMKKTRGKADPKIVTQLLNKNL